MKLAIFDVDGTLLDTNIVDAGCFVRALEQAFSITHVDTDWSKYEQPTDSGIAQSVFQKKFGRLPSDAEIDNLRTRFVTLLQESYKTDPSCFREIRGAKGILQFLLGTGEWKVAIATGCWYQSVMLKLKSAGLSVDKVPLSTSDDAPDRKSIVTLCIERARRYYGVEDFTKSVAIGDSSWDLETARKLKLGFVGVSDENSLTGLGATGVVKDYSHPSLFLQYLESATVPTLQRSSLLRAGF